MHLSSATLRPSFPFMAILIVLVVAVATPVHAQVSDFCYTTNSDRYWRQMSTNRSYPSALSAMSFDNIIFALIIDNVETITDMDFTAGSGPGVPIMSIPPPPNMAAELIANGSLNPGTQTAFFFVTPPVFISIGTPLLQRIEVAGGAPPAGMLNGAMATLEEEITNNFTEIELIGDDLSLNTFPQVYITEYCSDPSGPGGGLDTNFDGVPASEFDQSDDEFVEIVNGTASTINLVDWTLEDSVGVRHTFAAGSTLEPGRAIVVFGGGCMDGLPPFFIPLAGVAASSGALGLDNDGDTITLRDDVGVVVDTTTYVSGGPGDGDGESSSREPGIPNAAFVPTTSVALFNATPFSDSDLVPYFPGTVPALLYPGTGEDYCLSSGINGAFPSSGPGNDRKVIVPLDLIVTELDSPAGTFANQIFLFIATVFDHTGGAVVPEVNFFPLTLPGLYVDFGVSFIINTSTSIGPAVLPFSFSIVWPPGLGGLDLMVQGLTTIPTTANGFFVTSNGHVFEEI